jgi:hypothetical protein
MTQGRERSGWSWWDRLFFWGAFPVGIALLVLGNDPVDRLFGLGILAVPTAALCWAIWTFLHERRSARRDARHQPNDG